MRSQWGRAAGLVRHYAQAPRAAASVFAGSDGRTGTKELQDVATRARHSAAASVVAGLAQAQTKWDLPAAYPATNFHTENLVQFAADVDKATGGKLKITVHANGSLFKATEIKRAVQGGQAQIGEILLVNFENENPIYGADGMPFLATSYAESKKLDDGAEAAARQAARRAGHEAALHGALAAAGHLREQGDRLGRRHARPQVARLQPGHGQDRRADRRAAGDRSRRPSCRRRWPPAWSTAT